MKTKFLLTQTVLLVVMATVGVGCSSGGGSGFALQNGTATATNPNPGGLIGSGTPATPVAPVLSNTVAFVPDSMAVMTQYVASHPLNNPQNFQLTVNVADVAAGSNQYGGSVQLSYTDSGNNFAGNFITGSGSVQVASPGRPAVGTSNATFNKWFTFNGKQVFHGFFQDQYGAVILVVDNLTSTTGDGLAPNNGSGSIWFKNFVPGYATQSPEMCWFIQVGPYDCRTFLSGSSVVTTQALYPSNGYQRLGTFTGLNIKQAFNQ